MRDEKIHTSRMPEDQTRKKNICKCNEHKRLRFDSAPRLFQIIQQSTLKITFHPRHEKVRTRKSSEIRASRGLIYMLWSSNHAFENPTTYAPRIKKSRIPTPISKTTRSYPTTLDTCSFYTVH